MSQIFIPGLFIPQSPMTVIKESVEFFTDISESVEEVCFIGFK